MASAPTTFSITSRAGTIREIIYMAAPLIVSHMSNSVMWVVDAAILGRVGTVEQGAVGLGGMLVWAIQCFFAGTITAVSILVAQNHGAGRSDLARHVRSGLVLVLPMSLMVALLWPIVPSGLALLGVTEAVRPHAQDYIATRLLSTPFVFASYALSSYLRGVGDTITPMWVVLLANVFNALAAVLLVFGLGGFAPMGAAGAGLATSLACVLEFVLYAIVFVRSEKTKAHGARSLKLPSIKELGHFVALGAPIGLSWLFEMGAWTAFAVYAATRPPAELAAHTILFQVSGFCFMPAVAVGIAASVLVGQYLGANRLDLVRKSAKNSLIVGVSYMAIVGTFLAIIRKDLFMSFNPDPQVVALGGTLAIIAAIYQPFDGFGIISQGILRGAAHTSSPTLIMLGSGGLVFVPLVWWLGEKQGMGVTGGWIAAVVHLVVVAAALGTVLMRKKTFREHGPIPEPLPDLPHENLVF